MRSGTQTGLSLGPVMTRGIELQERSAANRQFLVQDPDGYLLRFAQDLGAKCRADVRFVAGKSRSKADNGG